MVKMRITWIWGRGALGQAHADHGRKDPLISATAGIQITGPLAAFWGVMGGCQYAITSEI
jgi:hypothetical protein